MARRTFFSFHHERDSWRAGQVRNSWLLKGDREAAGFWDSAEWEKVKDSSDPVIRAWIDKQLNGTSVTVVLIGNETASRKYVKYEIEQSISKNNGILGVRIHQVKDNDKERPTDPPGANPLPAKYKVYDWVDDDGRENMGAWIEAAAREAGR